MSTATRTATSVHWQPEEESQHRNRCHLHPSFADIRNQSCVLRPGGSSSLSVGSSVSRAPAETKSWTSYQFKNGKAPGRGDPDPNPGDEGNNNRGDKFPKRSPNGPGSRDHACNQDQTPARTSGPQFDQKLKFSDIPTWDGNTSTIISWIWKIDDYSYWSEAINEQLGRIIPMRLTGSAERWYYSLLAIHRGDIEQSWDQLHRAIVSYYMNRKFWEEQKAKATCATYR